MDTYHFLSDPRTLSLAERRAMQRRHERDQRHWLARLHTLADAPKPDVDFPAYLLATGPFADLAQRLGGARERSELPPEVADELDWFLVAFADYLRTEDGEDAFAEPQRRTG